MGMSAVYNFHPGFCDEFVLPLPKFTPNFGRHRVTVQSSNLMFSILCFVDCCLSSLLVVFFFNPLTNVTPSVTSVIYIV